jgi:hypothetical protein
MSSDPNVSAAVGVAPDAVSLGSLPEDGNFSLVLHEKVQSTSTIIAKEMPNCDRVIRLIPGRGAIRHRENAAPGGQPEEAASETKVCLTWSFVYFPLSIGQRELAKLPVTDKKLWSNAGGWFWQGTVVNTLEFTVSRIILKSGE